MKYPTSLPEAGQAPACSADGAITSPPLGSVPTPSATETPAANGAADQVIVTRTPLPEIPEVPDAPNLTIQQRKALGALLSGKSLSAVASEVGVDRTTLYRWRMKNPNFIAFLNVWRHQSRQTVADTVQLAAEQASQVVLDAINRGDVRSSLTVLKATGSFTTRPTGPLDAMDVIRTMKCKLQNQASKLLESRMEARSKSNKLNDEFTAQILEDQDDELLAELQGGSLTPEQAAQVAARKEARAQERREWAACMGFNIVSETPPPPDKQPPQEKR